MRTPFADCVEASLVPQTRRSLRFSIQAPLGCTSWSITSTMEYSSVFYHWTLWLLSIGKGMWLSETQIRSLALIKSQKRWNQLRLGLSFSFLSSYLDGCKRRFNDPYPYLRDPEDTLSLEICLTYLASSPGKASRNGQGLTVGPSLHTYLIKIDGSSLRRCDILESPWTAHCHSWVCGSCIWPSWKAFRHLLR